MNYDKLSRSLRQYYKKGIMKKTERSQRLVYQFCHPYHLWAQDKFRDSDLLIQCRYYVLGLELRNPPS